jgi:phosphohistidine swiveling domain-containing protein
MSHNEENLRSYLASTNDWYRSIARPNLMFDGTMFLDIYRKGLVPGMEKGFEYQVLLYKRGFSTYYRSKGQIEDLLKNELIEAAKDIQAVGIYRERGLAAFAKADACIADIAKVDSFEKLKEFGPRVVDAMRESIQYGTLVPYWIMNAVERAGFTRERPGPYAHIFNEFDVLRADSRNVNLRELVYEKMWIVIAKHFTIATPEIISSLTHWEFRDLLTTGILIDTAVLEKRHNGCIAWYPGNSDELQYSFDAEMYEEVFRRDAKDFSGTEFKGAIAQKGIARGRVRILFTNADGKSFEEGDIVVSTSTSPNLMPFLIRCGAIVTDEGGIASHAAIVSRELKKPCVIATKIATQVLKDGDLVEVDANNGVVRILERNKN